jgi:hypothetical protein
MIPDLFGIGIVVLYFLFEFLHVFYLLIYQGLSSPLFIFWVF